MSNELQQDYLSGKIVYYLLRNASAQIWNGAAFENYTTANYAANYPISATEQGTASGYYVGSMPVVAAGIYAVIAKQQVGAGPLETDITIGTGTLIWDGTSIQNLSSIVAAVMQTDIGGSIENSAAVHSLATAVLKLVSKFDVGTGTTAQTFKTDGVTVKMTQTEVKNAALVPIQSLGVGS